MRGKEFKSLPFFNTIIMKKILWFIAIMALCVVGYYAFSVGWILVKVFIGLMFVAVFAFGVWIGHVFTSKKQ
jgi:CHASE2 domain-containing sensor protein